MVKTPVSGPRQPGVGAGVGTEVDEEQPAPIVLQGPGVGVKVDVGQNVPVLQGQAANVLNLQLTLQWLQQVSVYSQRNGVHIMHCYKHACTCSH